MQKELRGKHCYQPVQLIRKHLPFLLFRLKKLEASNNVLRETEHEGTVRRQVPALMPWANGHPH